MQIPFGAFNEADYDDVLDDFVLIINRRVLIKVTDYYGGRRSAFRTVVIEHNGLELSRLSESAPYTMVYDPDNATIVVDVAFSDRQEAISKAYAVAASY